MLKKNEKTIFDNQIKNKVLQIYFKKEKCIFDYALALFITHNRKNGGYKCSCVQWLEQLGKKRGQFLYKLWISTFKSFAQSLEKENEIVCVIIKLETTHKQKC